MPIISGGGGGGGGTPTLPLTLAGATNTASDLLVVDEPAGYADNSPSGRAWRITDGTINTLLMDAYGVLTIKAPTGQGLSSLALLSVDDAGYLATLGDTVVYQINHVRYFEVTTTATTIATAAIGFFGATPAAQPAHPVTLADVIAALVSLGLVAA